MRWVIDDDGRKWTAERIGRTSGLIPVHKDQGGFPQPLDIVRFSCESVDGVSDREVTTRAGVLEQMTDTELKALLAKAPEAS
jgi:hypothetical protein